MKRLTPFLTFSCLFSLAFSACGSVPAQLPPASASPAPIASSAPAASWELKLEGIGECGMEPHLRYAVSTAGLLRYAEGEEIKSRQLSESELAALKATVAEANLGTLFAHSERVPEDAPQTMECRIVDTLTLSQKGPAETFDRNGRQYHHSDAYRAAFQKVIEHLERLSQSATETSPVADAARYGLALKVKLVSECELPGFTRYSVSPDGELTWTEEEWPTLTEDASPPTQRRQLTATEQAELIGFLDQAQLLATAENSEPVPADAPQTRECRTVTVYELEANGKTQSFEGESTRKFRHNSALLEQLEALQNKLRELSSGV